MSGDAGIIFSDATQAVWFVELGTGGYGPGNGDYLAAIETLADGRIKLTYRLRWYRDEKTWESKDRKDWYEGVTDLTLDEVIAAVRNATDGLKQATGRVGKIYELIRGNRSPREFFDLFMQMPFAHAKRVSEAEYQAMQAGKEHP